jgi:hypothetical protein
MSVVVVVVAEEAEDVPPTPTSNRVALSTILLTLLTLLTLLISPWTVVSVATMEDGPVVPEVLFGSLVSSSQNSSPRSSSVACAYMIYIYIWQRERMEEKKRRVCACCF